ncbi:uncharacterized protein KY384_004270 [Bacidia gigantensis]|uniref:uncharacterized protein n=1 Tax=Bacidia gigantensis TaxID=2732470 RepID=UPI001D05BF78|nr:uncharacterized protein KY384_004270 [Bacidia gigantensis]KAG8530913.1 hypothetical protein KY384_004270 [Bacidia gigantensis]
MLGVSSRTAILACKGSRHQVNSPCQRQIRAQTSGGFEDAVGQEKEKQTRTPWHREGSQLPPVRRPRSAGAMVKGKLLTTPSRLLKLILPLSTLDKNSDRKDIEPLALLVHPQQPLSYLERLIQSEVPLIKGSDGDDKIPRVYFRAEDSQEDKIEPKAPGEKKDDTPEDMFDPTEEESELEATKVDGETIKTGILRDKGTDTEMAPQNKTESNSDLGQQEQREGADEKFIRWSPSTEIGDFIRDAARSKEFAVEIEGAAQEILVGVPSFNDRTHFLRSRLRTSANKIIDMAAIKKECDMAAHRGAQRVAMAGGGILVSYWIVVYYLTFYTDLGWDVMEPVTYLVGLSTLIGGYLWFLYNNREVSYRAALNLTISRRQSKLYESKGFDLPRWESLIDEANSYRKDIKQIAREYDVDWDEKEDAKDERVTKAMKQVRDDRKAKRKSKDDDEDD